MRLLSRRVHVERTIFHSLSLNPLLSGCLSATRAGAARRSCGWFSPPHSSRMSRAVVLLFFFCRRSSSLSRAFSLVVVSCGTGPRQRASRPVVGVVRCVGIAAWGSSWPQEEEPRGRAAGAQKSRRSSPAAHPGNRQFLFFSKPPNSSAAPATEMADGRCGVREVRTSD